MFRSNANGINIRGVRHSLANECVQIGMGIRHEKARYGSAGVGDCVVSVAGFLSDLL